MKRKILSGILLVAVLVMAVGCGHRGMRGFRGPLAVGALTIGGVVILSEAARAWYNSSNYWAQSDRAMDQREQAMRMQYAQNNRQQLLQERNYYMQQCMQYKSQKDRQQCMSEIDHMYQQTMMPQGGGYQSGYQPGYQPNY